MNSKDIWEYLWDHKPFWERNSDEEIEHNKFLEELNEYYKQPKVL